MRLIPIRHNCFICLLAFCYWFVSDDFGDAIELPVFSIFARISTPNRILKTSAFVRTKQIIVACGPAEKKIWPWSISHRISSKITETDEFIKITFCASLILMLLCSASRWNGLESSLFSGLPYVIKEMAFCDHSDIGIHFFQQNEDVHRLFWYFAFVRWSDHHKWISGEEHSEVKVRF